MESTSTLIKFLSRRIYLISKRLFSSPKRAQRTRNDFLLNSSKIYNFLIKSYHIIRVMANVLFCRETGGESCVSNGEKRADNWQLIYFTHHILPPNSCFSVWNKRRKNRIIIKKGHKTRLLKKTNKTFWHRNKRKNQLKPPPTNQNETFPLAVECSCFGGWKRQFIKRERNG